MIDDPIPFPGGGGGTEPAQPASMSTQERKIWAASKGLPSNYLILTIEEMMTMRNSMHEQRAQCTDMGARFKKCIGLLGEYWKLEPDLVNAVGAAVFDADRYRKACELTAPKIQKIKDSLDAAITLAGPSLAPVVLADLLGASAALGREFVFIVEQMAKRRQRVKK